MKVYQLHKEKGATVQEITLDRAIELTEGRGYWKSGSVKEMLERGELVWTPFSYFSTDADVLKNKEF